MITRILSNGRVRVEQKTKPGSLLLGFEAKKNWQQRYGFDWKGEQNNIRGRKRY